MKHTIMTVGLCLLLGLLLSIGVGWYGARNYVTSVRQNFATGPWQGWFSQKPLATYAVASANTTMTMPSGAVQQPQIADAAPFWIAPDDIPDDRPVYVRNFAAGWPMRCVYCTTYRDELGANIEWDRELHGAVLGRDPLDVRSNEPWPDTTLLPYLPYAPGLIVDTFVFAAIGFLVIVPIGFLWRWSRARRRRKAGRCPGCAYDRRETTGVCPECGRDPEAREPLIGRFAPLALVAACVLVVVPPIFFLSMLITRDPWPPILHAAYTGDVDELQRLADEGVSLEQPVEGGRIGKRAPYPRMTLASGPQYRLAPLQAAAIGGDVQCVRWLLDRGVNIDPLGTTGVTPLEYACGWGHEEIAALLLDRGAMRCPDNFGGCHRVPIMAALSRDVDTLNLLLDEGYSVQENPDAVHNLLRTFGLNPSTPPMVERLLEVGAPVQPRTVAMVVQHNLLEYAELFAKHDVDLLTTEHDLPHVFRAIARNADVRIVELLLDAGTDVDYHDPKAGTPLTMAAMRGRLECVKLLLEHGADPNLPGIDDKTALHGAAESRNGGMVRVLLNAGADPSAISEQQLEWTTPGIRRMIEEARSDSSSPSDAA